MLLTERQLRKVIQKSILSHTSAKNMTLLESKAKRSKMLVETHRGTGFVTFGSLLERADRGLISSEQLSDILEEDFERINHQLLQEGILDVVQDAYEKVKGGAIKLKDTISDASAEAMAKINEKYIEWTTKIWMVIQKGKVAGKKALQLLQKAFDTIQVFKKKHPILFGVIKAILIIILIFIIMVITTKSAHAGVDVAGLGAKAKGAKAAGEGVQLDQGTVDQVYGCLKHAQKGAESWDGSKDVLRDVAILFKKSASNGQTIDPTTMADHAQTCLAKVQHHQDVISQVQSASEPSQAAITAMERSQRYLDAATKLGNKIIKEVGELDNTKLDRLGNPTTLQW